MTSRGWKHFSHQADIGICGWGPSLSACFEEAAKALTAAITTAAVQPAVKIDVACEAADPELLLVRWLNAIIYEMAVRNMIFGRFEVHVAGPALTGSLWGEPVDRIRHEPACEPKGATFTELKVSDERGRWMARCVVDV